MNLKTYAAQKVAGTAILSKVGPATAAVDSQKFDPDTRVLVSIEREQFNLQGIDDKIAELRAQLAALQEGLDAQIAFRAEVVACLEGPLATIESVATAVSPAP